MAQEAASYTTLLHNGLFHCDLLEGWVYDLVLHETARRPTQDQVSVLSQTISNICRTGNVEGNPDAPSPPRYAIILDFSHVKRGINLTALASMDVRDALAIEKPPALHKFIMVTSSALLVPVLRALDNSKKTAASYTHVCSSRDKAMELLAERD